jgi:hypothetical protein
MALQRVFVILRYDAFQDVTAPIENRITVTSVVNDERTAETEVSRLQRLNAAKGCHYFWQSVRQTAE